MRPWITSIFRMSGALPPDKKLAVIGRGLPHPGDRVEIFTEVETGLLTFSGYRRTPGYDRTLAPGTIRMKGSEAAIEYVREKLGARVPAETAQPAPAQSSRGVAPENTGDERLAYPTIPAVLAGDIEPPLGIQDTRRGVYLAQGGDHLNAQCGSVRRSPSFDAALALSIVVHARRDQDVFGIHGDFVRAHWQAIVEAALKAEIKPQSQETPSSLPVGETAVPAARRKREFADYARVGDSWMRAELDKCSADDVSGGIGVRSIPMGGLRAEEWCARDIVTVCKHGDINDLSNYIGVGFVIARDESEGSKRGLFDACLRKRIWEHRRDDVAVARFSDEFQRCAAEDPRVRVLYAMVCCVWAVQEEDPHRRALFLSLAKGTLRRVVSEKTTTALWYTPLLEWCLDCLDAARPIT